MGKTPVKSKKKRSTTPYVVAEHLRTPEEMAAYLDAWLEEAPEDATGIARALGDIARAKGMAQVAKDAGLSREMHDAVEARTGKQFFHALAVGEVEEFKAEVRLLLQNRQPGLLLLQP